MKKVKFVQDVAELVAFGTGLWGIIALLSILLPLVNLVVKVVPLRPEVSELGTIIAMIAAFFAFAYSFTEKTHIMEYEMRRPFYRGEVINPRREMLHNSVSRLAWGLVGLAAYIALDTGLGILQGQSTEASKWLLPVVPTVAAIIYGIAFALVTGAFGALAVMQHVRPQAEAPRAGAVDLGVADETRSLSGERRLTTSTDGINDSHHQK